MKILLIIAANTQDPLKQKAPIMPLSLPILAGAAPNHDYEFIDMLKEGNAIDFNKTYDLVGISYRVSAEKMAYKVADRFREKGVTVVLGGPQATACPFEAKEHADIVVVGEAEELWPKFLNDLNNNTLQDFYVSATSSFEAKNHSFFQAGKLPELTGSLVPKRTFFKHRYTFDTVYAARGCPINCDFCMVSEMHGKKMRFRNINDVMNEVKTFKKFFYLLDDNVFGRKDSYDFYLELFEALKNLPKKKYWTGQANLDASGNEKGRQVIKAAAESGLVYAAVGIESIHLETLKKSGSFNKMGVKNAPDFLAKMKENIRFIQNQGIIISGWFAIGYEDDTVDTYHQSLDFCLDTNIFPVFTPIQVFPGTRLFEKAQKQNKYQDRYTHVSSYKNLGMKDTDVLEALRTCTDKGYSKSQIKKNNRFYKKIFRKQRFSLTEKINRTVFTKITQKKLKRISYAELKRLEERVYQKK